MTHAAFEVLHRRRRPLRERGDAFVRVRREVVVVERVGVEQRAHRAEVVLLVQREQLVPPREIVLAALRFRLIPEGCPCGRCEKPAATSIFQLARLRVVEVDV
jgi:hypothetical protein